MKSGGGINTILRIAMYVAVICAVVFSLTTSDQLNTYNRSLLAQIDELNGLLAQQREEISRLNAESASNSRSSADTAADPSADTESDSNFDASGVWELAPPKIWSEYRDYQELYPNLYSERPDRWFVRKKTVYLTFDDGPSIYTELVLDVLKEKNIKGSFFIVGNSVARLGEKGDALLRRMVDEGHTIGVHCNVHVYDRIYTSIAAFLDDFNAIHMRIRETAGVDANIFRFPGGSVNNYNSKIRSDLFDEMTRRGFTYYDWNASCNDTARNVTEESAWRSATLKAGKSDRVIILMHDTREVSVRALPRIIDTYMDSGYSFDCLTNIDKPITL
jgi:peptidoglycan/xylan/chitin deacetylase (PgdA/CDA1 family)